MLEVLAMIRNATIGTPFEGDLWLVGGAVRDSLIEPDAIQIARVGDLDLVTRGSSSELGHLLFQKKLSAIPPVTYARFGTAMVRVQDVDIEIVTARKESYTDDSRKPEVEPATYEEDARRRDFTVNALLQSVHTGELWDPLGVGMGDLCNKILRTPLDPEATFFDDPLRMLRAIRFRWKLGFEPAENLYPAIRVMAGRLEIISAERIRDEFIKMLALPQAAGCLQDLLDLGLLAHFAPEVVAMVGCEQGKYHFADVWLHTLKVVSNIAPADPLLVLAAFLHDVGKPPTRFVDSNGDIRFFGHEGVGAELTERIMRRLKFSERDIHSVSILVANHMRLGSAQNFTPSAARRLIRDLGDDLERLLTLIDADSNALRTGVKVMDLNRVREVIAHVGNATPVTALKSPLTGKEIMTLKHLLPGPEVGRFKQILTEAVLDGVLSPDDHEGAVRMLLALK